MKTASHVPASGERPGVSARASKAWVRRGGRALLLVAAVLAGGCGDPNAPKPGVTVVGVVVKDGVPFVLPGREVGLGDVEIQLVPLALVGAANGSETGLQIETAIADGEGRFQVKGPGRGVPPGTYRLSVRARDKGFDSDALQGAFSPEKTPVEIVLAESLVGGSYDAGTIDVTRPATRGTK